jgi:hypothetical protein
MRNECASGVGIRRYRPSSVDGDSPLLGTNSHVNRIVDILSVSNTSRTKVANELGGCSPSLEPLIGSEATTLHAHSIGVSEFQQ